MGIPRNLSNLAPGADTTGVLGVTKGGTGVTTSTGTGSVVLNTNPELPANLTFTGTGNRITGDFSNATVANRLAFQTSTTNGTTTVDFIPNGTGSLSQAALWNNSNTANASFASLAISNSLATLTSGISGTGTYLPLTMFTGGSERLRIDTSGNVGIGTSSPSSWSNLAVLGSNGTGFTGITSINSNANVGIAGIQFASDPTYTKAAIGLLRSQLNGAGSIVFYNDSNNDAANWSTGDEKLRITSEGNVGIGTSSPAQRLHVSSTSSGAQLQLTYPSVRNYTIGATSDFALAFRDADANLERLRITANGGVSFGSSGTAYGSAGQVLTSNGDAPPTWQTAGGGDLVLIGTRTGSNVATYEWTGLTGYNNYLLVISYLNPVAAPTSLVMQVGTGSGPTYQTSGYEDAAVFGGASAVSVNDRAGEPSMRLTDALRNQSASSIPNTGVFTISNMTNGNSLGVVGNLGSDRSGAGKAIRMVYGARTGTSVYTAIRIFVESGNINSGYVSLYGIKS